MKFSKRELVLVSLIGVLLLVVSLSFIFNFDNNSDAEELNWYFEEEADNEQVPVEQKFSIIVDVKGQVVLPGVYELEEGQRMKDLIELAGGLTPDADEMKINLAAILSDAMAIYIPKVGEEDSTMIDSVMVGNESSTSKNGKVNINQATAEELQKLPGIGPAKATAIIAYRDENGPFQTIDDLQNVSGIGPKSIEKMSDEITTR
ncbi:helix-hairpin-helix domain-containing protein [Alkalihalobacterium chitinilyticum]|uniref:Helix-hairpin-helix domain-containing protein n=1 Tax=Alkalihalobacterium chitinilyticum TaxID=2980103 RepID=A0ABT5VHY3_9BACI|nr:helix-hairpin-helix domain-containing protein [Alkalihalobacterium chitinilyticum]MDE5413849.1 helix-hairpin-helix domain-containing protein [Alkalihalobacterium chitinilyticum]